VTVNVDDVAAAVLRRVGTMETMKLQKLLYYSQAWHVAITDEPLFEDEIQAWSKGPVVDRVWQERKGWRNVTSWPQGNADNISGPSAMVVDLVCSVYGRLSGDDLSELTHDEEPWRATRGDLPESARANRTIPLELMRDFYRQRTLNDRYPADIAAGGTEYAPGDPLDIDTARTLIAEALGKLGIVAAADAGGDEDGGALEVRLNRERPLRASSRQ